ncbi:MAG: DUF167 domain-containing protein [Deltaproteobacteria bacterium]|nr:DUF167 domain-containing protein [Deltaproteobacteria bacterium]
MIMKIQVLVKPNSKRMGLEETADGQWIARVNAPATEGKANTALVELLKEHFKVPKSAVRIVHGEHGRKKLVEIIFQRS